MIRVFLSLLLRAIVVITAVAIATFVLLWNAPGDPALAIAMARYNEIVSSEVLDQIRAEAGLNAGFWAAFKSWIGPLLVGDFGKSSVTGREVWPELATAVSYTVPLAFLALALGLCISLPLAIMAANRPGSLLDRAAVGLASLGAAIPAYWLGLLLILLFALHLGWLPAMGARTAAHIVLPALTLALSVSASLTRIIRSGILEAREQHFLPAFRRRGVAQKNIEWDHIAPHATIPVITVLGLELAFLLEGLLMVEVIFGRPGLGGFLVKAIEARDFPKVQAVVLLTALVFVIINLVIDLLFQVIDPRIGERDA